MLTGINYGDGLILPVEISIKDDNSFEMEYYVAFSHIPGRALDTDTELIVYGRPGLPIIVPLINPVKTKHLPGIFSPYKL